jgi:hypothetical protein
LHFLHHAEGGDVERGAFRRDLREALMLGVVEEGDGARALRDAGGLVVGRKDDAAAEAGKLPLAS